MVLSDRDIRRDLSGGKLRIDPLGEGAVQPASVDLRLGRELLVFQNHLMPYIDIKQPMSHLTSPVEIDEINPFVLHPGEFVLGVTLEYVVLPDDLVGRLDGKSSLGRLGLVVHSTAGFVDPGWKGNLTLELSNLANLPIYLYFGMKVSQISFMRLSSPAEHPYGSSVLGSKYQGQRGPTASRFFQDYSQASGSPRDASPASRPNARTSLRDWLSTSEFQGGVKPFAETLGVKQKTVENWLYGRTSPSARFRAKLYLLTQLPQFRVDQLRLSESGT